MSCKHSNAAELRAPGPTQSVYREDCTQCFGSIDDPTGLDVCLSCFNGACQKHSQLHHRSTSHPLVLNIQRTRKPVKRDEPPQKMSKLAIAAETEQDRYDTKTRFSCHECRVEELDPTQGKLPELVDGILKASTFARQAEVQAWEQEFTPCEHTLCLEQETPRRIQSQDLGHCSMCELKENLWLCLTCGNLGCGREQYGGIGGNSHGLAHADATAHPVAVKLGSLTPEGTADVYCYRCNEERIDTELPAHLAHWGINIADRQKTEKSLTEMQIEHNLTYDFSMTTEDGKELQPLFGKGFTGLKNLGNSCYLASTLQCLFSLPAFQERYFLPHEPPPPVSNPADDLETQLRKIADGLLSGGYSFPDPDVTVPASTGSGSATTAHQRGLAPAMFKHLIGKGHEEFSTMRQQDAFELLQHLSKLIDRSSHPSPLRNPVQSFRFVLEQRLQCLECKRVRYRTDEQDNISVPVPVRRIPKTQSETKGTDSGPGAKTADKDEEDAFEPVTLKECLDIFTAMEQVELTCPACNSPSKAGFSKRSRFRTFPQTLIINARRFELVNWVPTKLDIPVVVSDGNFTLDAYFSPGPQPDEEMLPEDETQRTGKNAEFVPNAAAMAQLEAMGFPPVRCEKALRATGNEDAEAAMNWLFAHMEDPDIDDPIPTAATAAAGDKNDGGGARASGAAAVSQESIILLAAMGISTPQARKALRETAGNVERAVDWVFSHPDDPGDVGEEGANPTAASGDATVVTTDGGPPSTVAERVPSGSSELPATFRLSSIVCHKGRSIHAGHYVSFVRKNINPENTAANGGDGTMAVDADEADADNGSGKQGVGARAGQEQWTLFNDEKVVKAVDVEEMKKFAYVYFFERV